MQAGQQNAQGHNVLQWGGSCQTHMQWVTEPAITENDGDDDALLNPAEGLPHRL